jgi:hypothetical protein
LAPGEDLLPSLTCLSSKMRTNLSQEKRYLHFEIK